MSSVARASSRFAAVFAGGTMISRVTGLARDIAINTLPVGSREAFWVAFTFPNTLREVIGEGAMNAAFVPVYTETLEKESRESFRRLVSASLGMMIVVLLALTLAGMWLAPWLAANVNHLTGITGGKIRPEHDLVRIAALSRWCFPYLLLIGLAVFAMGPLFTLRRYATSSWSPSLLNIALIAACVIVWNPASLGLPKIPIEPAFILVFGVWAGGVAHVLVQFAAMRRHAGVLAPSSPFGHPGVGKILLLMGPVLLGHAAGEINKLVSLLFSYSLPDGAVTALNNANRLVQLPLGIFGVATSVAILPILSAAVARGDFDESRTTLIHGFRQSAFLVMPAMLGLMALGEPIVRLLFERAYFTSTDTANTSLALIPYAASLLAFAWVKVCLSGFYARHDTKTPVGIATISILLNIGLNVLLIKPLGFLGLAISTTIAQWVNFLLLYLVLGKYYGVLWSGELVSGLLRIFAASSLAIVIGYAAFDRAAALWPGDTLAVRAVVVAAPVAVAAIAYAGLCVALRVEELGHFASILARGKSRD